MKRILLVEDEDGIRTMLECVLRSADYEVDSVRTGTAARLLVHMNVYALVVTDWKLPDGTGMAIADDATAAGSKAIIITGSGPDMPKADRPPYELLVKPFRQSEFVAAVERQIGPAGIFP